MFTKQALAGIAPAIKYQPKPGRYYFDVALGSILLSGEDTGGAHCLPRSESRTWKRRAASYTYMRG